MAEHPNVLKRKTIFRNLKGKGRKRWRFPGNQSISDLLPAAQDDLDYDIALRSSSCGMQTSFVSVRAQILLSEDDPVAWAKASKEKSRIAPGKADSLCAAKFCYSDYRWSIRRPQRDLRGR